jgi:hypothetical protein
VRRAVRAGGRHVRRRREPSLTIRQVLDQLVALVPAYQWFEMDGVSVIRPAGAWTALGNVLNSRVAALHIAEATVGDTLATILANANAS